MKWSEHCDTEKNGKYGQTYFYQSELPYDVDHSYGDAGYSSYVVSQNAIGHKGFGLGVYSFFRDHDVSVQSGIRAPSDAMIVNPLTVFLNGYGLIQHVLNEQGSVVQSGAQVEILCQ